MNKPKKKGRPLKFGEQSEHLTHRIPKGKKAEAKKLLDEAFKKKKK